ncbi:hypothetical protein C8Q77DRAFT_151130 [Trametes polyzona]|nr:hypothetical protein C8Q77DRAFT_151130 [Trametes polyzona]
MGSSDAFSLDVCQARVPHIKPTLSRVRRKSGPPITRVPLPDGPYSPSVAARSAGTRHDGKDRHMTGAELSTTTRRRPVWRLMRSGLLQKHAGGSGAGLERDAVRIAVNIPAQVVRETGKGRDINWARTDSPPAARACCPGIGGTRVPPGKRRSGPSGCGCSR